MSSARRVCVVTGTRAEFGLLRPVMDAIRRRPRLELLVVASGAHLLRPARTIREVEAEYAVAARVAMQRDGVSGRLADAEGLGRGVTGFAAAFGTLEPDWVVVLGDRIEALAAASAASIGGIAVCHIHGGDRAEGIADEAMRHAISKLSHVHCAATNVSAKRLIRMGEPAARVHVTGSPAIDGVSAVKAMTDRDYALLGRPSCVILHHPSGVGEQREAATIDAIMHAVESAGLGNALCLGPNHDPNREVIVARLRAKCAMSRKRAGQPRAAWRFVEHLPRATFLSLLKRVGTGGGFLIGNSSAGLIEVNAMSIPAVNVGPRQAGRERGEMTVNARAATVAAIKSAIRTALGRHSATGSRPIEQPYGDGRAGARIAAVLSGYDPRAEGFTRKRNAY
jgi:UDP-hydrolysing UDP-N-acetyl-D-glucosamine 2-epimerase